MSMNFIPVLKTNPVLQLYLNIEPLRWEGIPLIPHNKIDTLIIFLSLQHSSTNQRNIYCIPQETSV